MSSQLPTVGLSPTLDLDETQPLLPPPAHAEPTKRAPTLSSIKYAATVALRLIDLFVLRPLCLACFSLQALMLCNIVLIFAGILLVSIWDALTARGGSPGPIEGWNALLRVYELLLRTACVGAIVLSVSIGCPTGLLLAVHELCMHGFGGSRDDDDDDDDDLGLTLAGRIEDQLRRKSGLISGLCLFVLLGTGSMATGVFVTRWWNGGDNEVTANPLRSIAVAAVGYLVFVVYPLYLCMRMKARRRGGDGELIGARHRIVGSAVY